MVPKTGSRRQISVSYSGLSPIDICEDGECLKDGTPVGSCPVVRKEHHKHHQHYKRKKNTTTEQQYTQGALYTPIGDWWVSSSLTWNTIWRVHQKSRKSGLSAPRRFQPKKESMTTLRINMILARRTVRTQVFRCFGSEKCGNV